MSALPVASQTPENTILHGDCLAVLRDLPSDSVDAIVTDPPAGISFMGKGWDSNKGGRDAWISWLSQVMAEALRVLKPGGHALVWALPRTSHWTAMALEDAGFEVRDCVTHLFGSGFPKSLDVSKALDKRLGATRTERLWKDRYHDGITRTPQEHGSASISFGCDANGNYITAPATDAARAWDGWGTALKPAAEFWWLCRKPLAEKTVAANVLRWGTGALNIGASRVESGRDYHDLTVTQGINTARTSWEHRRQPRTFAPSTGRWPANLLLSHTLFCDETACALDCPVRALDAQSGDRGLSKKGSNNGTARGMFGLRNGENANGAMGYGDTGGASRYFQTFAYVPKASRSERNRGCSQIPPKQVYGDVGETYRGLSNANKPSNNSHPTVKPLALMSWLIGLITPPGGLVLDPFAGSGSTLVAAKEGGWRYLGIEREREYVAIAQARLEAALSTPTIKPAPAKPKRMRTKKQPQPTLLEVSA